ncbi:restriction endonuclease [Pseudarthrobacter sp. PH31-O2]|uniref:restriction endonuclease n=1 Tax=Pseudarthrobacter sp. PH31-O2 TaxID=3046206 RepID=UPI0024BB166A|nr:restriction endonuclease [Pseudarthrobacter sp. PH31-O2]MDJ0353372.1 restriction endonuclease [Pseudarthrobacter sp. PH31-O2]
MHEYVAPLLNVLNDGQAHSRQDLFARVSVALQLSDDERAERLPSGTVRWTHRLSWAITECVTAGFVVRVGAATYEISSAGKAVIESGQPIVRQTIKGTDMYRAHKADLRARKRQAVETSGAEPSALEVTDELDEESSPTEALINAEKRLNDSLEAQIYESLLQLDSQAFERLILQVVQSLGYGTDRQENLRPTQYSGDKGIDGIIWQDSLGFDRVYLQAKRYAQDRAIGGPDVQAFSGALMQHRATKGLFITTSRFTTDAQAVARETLHYSLKLIDGQRLAELMVRYGVGVQVESTIAVKKFDQDFFDSI